MYTFNPNRKASSPVGDNLEGNDAPQGIPNLFSNSSNFLAVDASTVAYLEIGNATSRLGFDRVTKKGARNKNTNIVAALSASNGEFFS